jgi:hypothetical protein
MSYDIIGGVDVISGAQGAPGKSAKQVLIETSVLAPGTTDAAFAAWLAAPQAVVQPATAAAALAVEKAGLANDAAGAANTAAGAANSKATLADQKATLADQKATLADQAAIAAQAVVTAGAAILTAADTTHQNKIATEAAAAEAIGIVEGMAISFEPQFTAAQLTGFSIIAANPAKPYEKQILATFDISTGSLKVPRITLPQLVDSGQRWLFAILSALDHIGVGLDKRFRVRGWLDEWSISKVQEGLVGVGEIAYADLPLIRGKKATYGLKGSIRNVLTSDAYGRLLQFSQLVANPTKIGLMSSAGVETITLVGQSLSIGAVGSTPNTEGQVTSGFAAEICHMLNDGNGDRGAGAGAYPVVTTAFLVPHTGLVGSGGEPDTGAAWGTWWAAQNAHLFGLAPVPTIVRGQGVGGARLAQISKGGFYPAFQNGLNAAETMQYAAKAHYGPDVVVRQSAVYFSQGEADTADNMAQAPWEGLFDTYVNDTQADQKAKYPGQTEDIRFFIKQLAAGATDYIKGAGPISQAQLQRALNRADTTIFPGHMFLTNDNVHLYPRAYGHTHEYFQKMRLQWKATGVKPLPCYIKSAVYSSAGGHHIDVTFHVPVGNLRVFDSSNGGWLNPHPTFGMSAGSSTTETVTGASIIDRDTVRLTLSGAPGSARWVSVGYNEGGGFAATKMPYSYSTLFDEDPAPSNAYPARGLPNGTVSQLFTY